MNHIFRPNVLAIIRRERDEENTDYDGYMALHHISLTRISLTNYICIMYMICNKKHMTSNLTELISNLLEAVKRF